MADQGGCDDYQAGRPRQLHQLLWSLNAKTLDLRRALRARDQERPSHPTPVSYVCMELFSMSEHPSQTLHQDC